MDHAEFETWYRQEHPRVVAALSALSRDVDVGRELADEAFARALVRARSFGPTSNPSGWVYGVALNLLRQAHRRRNIERRALTRLGRRVASELPEDRSIWDCVARLPERQRVAIALRYASDLPEADIAVAMKVTRGTVSSTLNDAKHRLRQLMDDSGVKEEVP